MRPPILRVPRTIAHYELALARRRGRDLLAWARLGERIPQPKPAKRRRGRSRHD